MECMSGCKPITVCSYVFLFNCTVVDQAYLISALVQKMLFFKEYLYINDW